MSKQIKKSYQKAIETVRKLGFKEPAAPATRTNPFTQVTRTLQPEAVMLYDFITTRTLVCGKDYTRQTWDNARYYFCETWPDEYYDLID